MAVPGSISSVDRLEVNQPLESVSRTSVGSGSGMSKAGSFMNSLYSSHFSSNDPAAVYLSLNLRSANQSAHR